MNITGEDAIRKRDNSKRELDAMTQSLYEAMPGAPPVPTCRGDRLWGEVDSTDHWAFCATIARLILQNR